MTLIQSIALALCGGNFILVSATVVVVGGLLFISTRPAVRKFVDDFKKDWNGGSWDG